MSRNSLKKKKSSTKLSLKKTPKKAKYKNDHNQDLREEIDSSFNNELTTDDKIFCESFEECSRNVLSYIGFHSLSDTLRKKINSSISSFSHLLKYSFLESIKLAVAIFGVVAFSIPSVEKIYKKGKNISLGVYKHISSFSEKVKGSFINNISKVGYLNPINLLKSIKNIISEHKVLSSISTVCLVLFSIKFCQATNSQGGLKTFNESFSFTEVLKNNLNFFPFNNNVGKVVIEYTGMFIDSSREIVNKIIEPINSVCKLNLKVVKKIEDGSKVISEKLSTRFNKMLTRMKKIGNKPACFRAIKDVMNGLSLHAREGPFSSNSNDNKMVSEIIDLCYEGHSGKCYNMFNLATRFCRVIDTNENILETLKTIALKCGFSESEIADSEAEDLCHKIYNCYMYPNFINHIFYGLGCCFGDLFRWTSTSVVKKIKADIIPNIFECCQLIYNSVFKDTISVGIRTKAFWVIYSTNEHKMLNSIIYEIYTWMTFGEPQFFKKLIQLKLPTTKFAFGKLSVKEQKDLKKIHQILLFIKKKFLEYKKELTSNSKIMKEVENIREEMRRQEEAKDRKEQHRELVNAIETGDRNFSRLNSNLFNIGTRALITALS